jgi:hypothetical protein
MFHALPVTFLVVPAPAPKAMVQFDYTNQFPQSVEARAYTTLFVDQLSHCHRKLIIEENLKVKHE